ncbi:protein kinase [Histoplasma capsulatum G186AR]|uniref:non-specific serine/threonine protein kinase n=2 Tax=Ajellomyces capsulatus TaxID=5037 RepID=C0NUY0_AJECG|nr:protein kinase [Histoplasma capsulatum G186AR]EEH04793.1 protein kinase [Histoplasma capsulatum G186AR]
MANLRNRLSFPISVLKHQPWPQSAALAPKLDIQEPVEEEKTPYYSPARFYPARLGEVLNGRYQLATKLGHGSNSTVWLARDLNQWRWLKGKYVTVKINANIRQSHKRTARSELDTLRILSKTNRHHQGWQFVRHLLDSFTLKSNSGNDHLSLVLEPLREPLWIYQKRFGGIIPSDILKLIIQMILHGLDYMHSECRIIHADLKPDNIMVKLEDPSLLEEAAADEFKNPLPQKVYPDGRTIYLARNNYGPPRSTTGIIRIVDFDQSVRGDKPNSGCIQAEVYRPPEVILDAGYSYSADIWSLGVMLWDIIEDRKLFENVYSVATDEYDEAGHLAHIAALLGSPPKDLLDRGKRTHLFYGPEGICKSQAPPSFNFNNMLVHLHGEDKNMFITFIKRMLKWEPEERSTAKELLQDPWLYAEFEED